MGSAPIQTRSVFASFGALAGDSHGTGGLWPWRAIKGRSGTRASFGRDPHGRQSPCRVRWCLIGGLGRYALVPAGGTFGAFLLDRASCADSSPAASVPAAVPPSPRIPDDLPDPAAAGPLPISRRHNPDGHHGDEKRADRSHGALETLKRRMLDSREAAAGKEWPIACRSRGRCSDAAAVCHVLLGFGPLAPGPKPSGKLRRCGEHVVHGHAIPSLEELDRSFERLGPVLCVDRDGGDRRLLLEVNDVEPKLG